MLQLKIEGANEHLTITTPNVSTAEYIANLLGELEYRSTLKFSNSFRGISEIRPIKESIIFTIRHSTGHPGKSLVEGCFPGKKVVLFKSYLSVF